MTVDASCRWSGFRRFRGPAALGAAATSLLASGACGGQAGQTVALLDYETVAPAAWQPRPPESSMRVAQFVTAGGGGGAEVVVFHFGVGQGGSAAANIERWQSQFVGPSGEPVTAEVWTPEGTTFPTTVAELEGTYDRAIGMGAAAGGIPGQALVAAVVETPRGNLFPQLHGPVEDVAAEREGFLDFVRSIGPADGG